MPKNIQQGLLFSERMRFWLSLKDGISNQIAPWFSSGLIFKGSRRGIKYESS
jgi:hypothetical protein